MAWLLVGSGQEGQGRLQRNHLPMEGPKSGLVHRMSNLGDGHSPAHLSEQRCLGTGSFFTLSHMELGRG